MRELHGKAIENACTLLASPESVKSSGWRSVLRSEQFFSLLAAASPESSAEQKQQVEQWQLTPEQAGPVRMLQWGGVSHPTPHWPSRWAALYQGTLYLVASETSAEVLQSHNIWNNR